MGFISVYNLFVSLQSEKVSYDEFREWLLANPETTTITRWLLDEDSSVSLSNDLETPTFYQTLAGVTHRKLANTLSYTQTNFVLRTHKSSIDDRIYLVLSTNKMFYFVFVCFTFVLFFMDIAKCHTGNIHKNFIADLYKPK